MTLLGGDRKRLLNFIAELHATYGRVGPLATYELPGDDSPDITTLRPPSQMVPLGSVSLPPEEGRNNNDQDGAHRWHPDADGWVESHPTDAAGNPRTDRGGAGWFMDYAEEEEDDNLAELPPKGARLVSVTNTAPLAQRDARQAVAATTVRGRGRGRAAATMAGRAAGAAALARAAEVNREAARWGGASLTLA